VWDSTLEDKRATLSKLFNTWVTPKPVFPLEVLEKIKAHMASTRKQTAPAPVPAPVPHGYILQRPVGMAGGTFLLQPQQVPFPGFAVAVPAPGGYISQAGRAMPIAAVTAALTAPSIAGQPVQLIPQRPMMPLGTVLQPQVMQQAATVAVLPPPGAPAAVVAIPPPSPPTSQWPYSQTVQQQQPARQQRPMQRRSASPSPLPQPPPPAKAKPLSPLPGNLTSGNITANDLDKLLSNLASGGLFAGGTISPPPEDDPAVKTTRFSASFIKVVFWQQGCSCSSFRFSWQVFMLTILRIAPLQVSVYALENLIATGFCTHLYVLAIVSALMPNTHSIYVCSLACLSVAYMTTCIRCLLFLAFCTCFYLPNSSGALHILQCDVALNGQSVLGQCCCAAVAAVVVHMVSSVGRQRRPKGQSRTAC
jgi:hypothetical protein